MKTRACVLAVLVPIGLLVPSCSSNKKETTATTAAAAAAATSADHSVYFGWLLGSVDIAAVALDVTPGDAKDSLKVSVYVCDGLGPPEGTALWFTGALGTEISVAKPLTLTAVGGTASLSITQVGKAAVLGSFVGPKGKNTFAAYPATGGAGIYQVTIDEALKIKGTSSDGNVLEGAADKAGTTTATITTAAKEKFEFTVHNLSLASPADLAAHGLKDDYRKYATTNQVPGEYVAVIAPGGSHWLGRAGAVRLGSPIAEIIGLDKKEFTRGGSVQKPVVGRVQPAP
jgi:hypothetical protein